MNQHLNQAFHLCETAKGMGDHSSTIHINTLFQKKKTFVISYIGIIIANNVSLPENCQKGIQYH